MKELTGPPVIGKRYLVPAIHYPFCGKLAWWPVLGPRHEDKALINFDAFHFHMDWRFASGWAVDAASGRLGRWPSLRSLGVGPYGTPLCTVRVPVPLLTTFKPMVCKRQTVPQHLRTVSPFDVVSAFYAGHEVHAGAHGLVCPHRGAPLHTLEPDADGVVVCPLHGLHICTRTNRVLPAPERMAML